jgi:hypothetical protein
MKKNKDYAWVLYLIVLAIAVLASSCESKSGHLLDGKVKAKVHTVNYDVLEGFMVDSSTVHIEYVDTMYTQGEIFWGAKSYVTLAHKCSDSTHNTCDGSCECDGYECN